MSSLARRGETVRDYGPDRALALLATVTGRSATDPVLRAAKITDVRMWDLATRVGDSFLAGRVLRAGDAAHEILPTGAMGLNLGIADADALAWRLRAGRAGPGRAPRRCSATMTANGGPRRRPSPPTSTRPGSNRT